MARTPRSVIPPDRLSDQIYALVRKDIRAGEFEPGRRLLEVDLAARYGVSRTPVREALLQLSREGILEGAERGYASPIYSRADLINRLDVKRLLDPALAGMIAKDAKPAEIRALAKILARETEAHEKNKLEAFEAANQAFRAKCRAMCKNSMLVRCMTLVDDQFEAARAKIHVHADNRVISIVYDQRVLNAIEARDSEAAVAATLDFLALLQSFYSDDLAGDPNGGLRTG
jgi:DNA-binding GntR family transcriptional regulator